MPLGTPLPPPLPRPLPPPARPSRLSWPGPRCRPRTIMPSTAAGGGRGPAAAAGARGGPTGRGTQEALPGAGRGCGVGPPASGRTCRNHEPGAANSQRALLGAGLPGKSLRRGRRRRRLPGHGPAQPPERAGGRGSWELSFLPSFLSLKSKSLPRGGARARGGPRAGSAVSLRGSAVHVGSGSRDPARRHVPATVARPGAGGTRGLRGASPVPPGLGKRPGGGGGRGCGRCGRVSRAAAARMSTEAARSRSVRPSARHATPGGPSRLATHSARPGARAARPPAPRPAAGDRGRESMPGASSPRALRIGRGVLGARVSPAAAVAKLTRSPRCGGHPPGPRLLPFFAKPPTSERAGETGRKGGGREARGDAASSPLGTSERAVLGAPPARSPAAGGSPGPGPPRPRRRLGRRLPGAYRKLLCGVTAFRLNPASSSRLPPPPRRCRMLARCAAPPPGSGRLRADATAHLGGRPAPGPGPAGGSRAFPAVPRREAGTEAAGPGLCAARDRGSRGAAAAAGWPYSNSRTDPPFTFSHRPFTPQTGHLPCARPWTRHVRNTTVLPLLGSPVQRGQQTRKNRTSKEPQSDHCSSERVEHRTYSRAKAAHRPVPWRRGRAT
ncbi:LRP chaperone MESD isoform X1 [Myotis daubentonii]|uniref:LRP chaperone MESD isoform X1 n=1 Tax=Myotis daubentonii TaxID=98922 RepID=UPI002872D8F7|nr:LRP chaperone MESD isoform X1 [Myotis daubentonii]